MSMWHQFYWTLICLPFLLYTQQSNSQTGNNISVSPTLNVGEGLIKLDVFVTDPSGTSVPGLGDKDFILLDNGQPSKIVSFRATPSRVEPPVSVMLVVDTFQVPDLLAALERQAVETFLRQSGGHLAVPISIFSFVNTGLFLMNEPTEDGMP